MEQRRKKTHPYTKQPELPLHLDGMISRLLRHLWRDTSRVWSVVGHN
jgi:hypothetical protein